MPNSPQNSSLDFEVERLAAGEAFRPLYEAAQQYSGLMSLEGSELTHEDLRRTWDPDLHQSLTEWLSIALPADEDVRYRLGPAFWNRIAQLTAIAGEWQNAVDIFQHVLGLKISPSDKAIVLGNLLLVQQRQGRMDAETLAALAEVQGLIAPTVRLHVVSGDIPEKVFEYKQQRAVIGRSPDCDIVLNHRAVGRRHAELYWENGQLWIMDLKSMTGLLINHQRPSGPVPLKEHDRIEIGGIELSVDLPELFEDAPSRSIFDDDDAPAGDPSAQSTATSLPVVPKQGPDSVLRGAAAPSPPKAPAADESSPPLIVDENVQFTVYRPQVVQPGKWHPLLAFAHLSEKPLDAAEDDLDPIAEVQRQAEQVLGEQLDQYQDLTQDSRLAVPREGELTFVPEVAGVRFNPPRRTFLWQEPVHREEFRLQAGSELNGKTARGRMTVYLGNLVLAELTLAFRVDASNAQAVSPPLQCVATRPYRKIFASYSHADLSIVEEIERYSLMLGDEYLRDWKHLRTGQVWNDRLMEMIREADVFQLFWSSNSMNSRYCRQEWEYALKLNRPSFIRPTYWEDPLPELPHENLPPDALRRLHFQRIPSALVRQPPAPPAPQAPAAPAARPLESLKRQIRGKLIGNLDLSRAGGLDRATLRRELRLVAEHLCDTEVPLLSRSERERLIEEVLDETIGLRPPEILPKEHGTVSLDAPPQLQTPLPTSTAPAPRTSPTPPAASGDLAMWGRTPPSPPVLLDDLLKKEPPAPSLPAKPGFDVHEPVACRSSPSERIQRWVKRRSGVLLAWILTLVGLAIVLIVAWQLLF